MLPNRLLRGHRSTLILGALLAATLSCQGSTDVTVPTVPPSGGLGGALATTGFRFPSGAGSGSLAREEEHPRAGIATSA